MIRKVVLLGAGQRGRIYANYMFEQKLAKIVAVVEVNQERCEDARKFLGVGKDNCYFDTNNFFAQGKIADAIIIASMDRDHYEHTIKAIELGYDILLEKPISPDTQECIHIAELAEKKGVKIVVCHVLRYTPFFSTIKEIIDSKRLGKVLSIQHNENIGNFHMAHSFVRGNWRNDKISSPIALQKTCHDMDILVWLVGSSCKQIASIGDLSYFTETNAPEGSSEFCLECKVADTCRFDARKCYLPTCGSWPSTVVTLDQTNEGLLQALRTSQYGRCVYRCDNNVCDRQSSLIEFHNGVIVNFTMSAFTNKMYRTIKVMCEHGEICGSDLENRIEIIPFASNQVDALHKEVIIPRATNSGHGGGDSGIVDDFFGVLNGENSNSRSSIKDSIESHLMVFAAEESRMRGKMVSLEEMRGK